MYKIRPNSTSVLPPQLERHDEGRDRRAERTPLVFFFYLLEGERQRGERKERGGEETEPFVFLSSANSQRIPLNALVRLW